MKRDSTVKIFFKFVNSASAAALQCQSEALLATAAEVLLQAQQLPRVEAAEGSTGSCLLLPGSLPVHQGYANAGADSTSMQENAHVEGFFLLFINMHVDKSPDHQCELREFRGRVSGYFCIQVVSLFLSFLLKEQNAHQDQSDHLGLVGMLVTYPRADRPKFMHTACAWQWTVQARAPRPNSQSTKEVVQLNSKQQQHQPHWGFTHNHVLHHKTKLTPMP